MIKKNVKRWSIDFFVTTLSSAHLRLRASRPSTVTTAPGGSDWPRGQANLCAPRDWTLSTDRRWTPGKCATLWNRLRRDTSRKRRFSPDHRRTPVPDGPNWNHIRNKISYRIADFLQQYPLNDSSALLITLTRKTRGPWASTSWEVVLETTTKSKWFPMTFKSFESNFNWMLDLADFLNGCPRTHTTMVSLNGLQLAFFVCKKNKNTPLMHNIRSSSNPALRNVHIISLRLISRYWCN